MESIINNYSIIGLLRFWNQQKVFIRTNLLSYTISVTQFSFCRCYAIF